MVSNNELMRIWRGLGLVRNNHLLINRCRRIGKSTTRRGGDAAPAAPEWLYGELTGFTGWQGIPVFVPKDTHDCRDSFECPPVASLSLNGVFVVY